MEALTPMTPLPVRASATAVADVGPAVSIRIARKIWPAVAGRSAHTVLADLALDVAPRSFVVLSGPSGCGKSTLLNLIAGLDTDVAGAIRFAARDPRLAYVFQSPRLLPWRTVAENVALALPDGDPRHARIPDLLARVGLAGAETAYPERLSLGMQRRAAIARAFVVEPDILLMDEPFVSLDDPTADALRALVLELWGQHPTTVLFVTHDRREAVRLGTRIVRLRTLPAVPDGDHAGNADADRAGRASLVADVPVRLSSAARTDPVALAAEQARVFGTP
jgi:NitT/TauT family transport system ATP-binding protein